MKTIQFIPSRSRYDFKCQQLSNCDVINMRAASYCDVTLIYYSDTVSMDAFIITMALSARAIQHGAHRHDCRGIYRCVLLLFRGRIEIDHSYGLHCRGLCCHSRHSTRGPAGAAARRPAHSYCAGSGSTNHSSADRIVVNSYILPRYAN